MLEQQHRKVARTLRLRIRPAAATATTAATRPATVARVEEAPKPAAAPTAQGRPMHPPRPSVLCCCTNCNRSGVQPASAVIDPWCRYCGSPKIQVRSFRARGPALRALEKYRAQLPMRTLSPAEKEEGAAARARMQAAARKAAEEPAAAVAVA